MTERVAVWDLGVRIFHWSLVTLFAIAYITGEDESLLHFYSGYIIFGLIGFRIIWGFIGGRHARFSDFLYSPGRVKEYLHSLVTGKPRHYLGHNPAGSWMIFALLFSVLATGYTGLELLATEGEGPLAQASPVVLIADARADSDDDDERGSGYESDEDSEEFWEEIHEFFANFTVFLVLIHVAGVIVASRVHRENLVKSMITGYKDGA